MSKWKSTFGVGGYLVMLAVGISVVGLGLRHIDAISQIADRLAAYAFDVAVPTMLIGLIPGARRVCGNTLLILSTIIGIGVWISGVEAVYDFWGLVPLIVGLCFMGVGPVPMGIVALFLHHHPREAVTLIVNLVVLFVVRFVGLLYIASAEKREAIHFEERYAQSLPKVIMHAERDQLRE